jgi:hypothetical protein
MVFFFGVGQKKAYLKVGFSKTRGLAELAKQTCLPTGRGDEPTGRGWQHVYPINKKAYLFR